MILHFYKKDPNVHSAVIAEEPLADSIFNNNVSRNPDSLNNNFSYNIMSDIDYLTPDYKVYYLTNKIPANGSYYLLYPNGLITDIRYRGELKYNTIFRKNNPTMSFSSEGVFIVEYFRIAASVNHTYEQQLNMLLTSKNIELDEDELLEFRKLLKGNMYETTKSMSNTPHATRFKTFYLRLVTYVPDSEFETSRAVYVNHSSSYLISGVPDETMVHPHNKHHDLYMSKYDANDIDIKNSVEITINDNSTNRPYYMNIGVEQVPILPSDINGEPNEATIKIKKNNTVVKETSVKLEDINSLGIYKDKETCRNNGDKKLKYELAKLQLDHQKVLSEDKILKLKLEHELNVIKHKTINLQLDMKYTKNKQDIELAMLKLKFHYSNYTEELAIRDKHINHYLNMQASTLKHKQAVEIHNRKMNDTSFSSIMKDIDATINVVKKVF